MNLERLDVNQVKQIYMERMVLDFSSDELRPLERILEPLNRGVYECLGLYAEDEMVGYIFLVKNDNDYFVDYLAVLPELRNKGVGGDMLHLLKEYLTGADSIILEVEDPDAATYDEDKNLRQRRLSFYLRNGFSSTGVKMLCFNVPYLILCLGNQIRAKEEIEKLYFSFYRILLPKDMFEKNVKKSD